LLAEDALSRASGKQTVGLAAPPRVVIDTNVWLDLFVFHDPAARALALALQGHTLVAICSSQTDAELLAVLARPRFARLAGACGSALMQQWQALAQFVPTWGSAPWQCRDSNDQKFLDLAYSAGAHTLFTKDRALLRLARAARRAGLRIIAPVDFDPAPNSCPVQNSDC